MYNENEEYDRSVYQLRIPVKTGGRIWDTDTGHQPEWWDKAGGYAIQGRAAIFIKEIVGDYYNVVGLPVSTLYQMLKEMDAIK